MTISVEYLVVAGGGGGGSGGNGGRPGGGGGAGGLRTSTLQINPSVPYTVTVGTGGLGVNQSFGDNGTVSTFASINASGGGGGGHGQSSTNQNGRAGGSGGGAQNGDGSAVGGAGNIGNYSPPEGFAGGRIPTVGGYFGGGGAGGTTTSGAGGIGVESFISGTGVYYAGGGGSNGGSGGLGGGGAGSTTGVGGVGTDNRGGGGGGGTTGIIGGRGGSGVVIIRYSSTVTITNTGNLASTSATAGGFTTTTFTSGTGNIEFSPPLLPGLYAPATVLRGQSFDVLLITENIANNTAIAYAITGATSADLGGDPLSGNFTVVGNQATVVIQTAMVPLNRTLTISANGHTATVTLVPAVSAAYLVVAGGGGGGSDMGGGGGAGGYIAAQQLSLTAGTYAMVVGGGGPGAPAGVGQPKGSNGQNSTFNNLTAVGGGGGASAHDRSTSPAGNGGSGGGASGGGTLPSGGSGGGGYGGGIRGLGTIGQGFDGGTGIYSWFPGGGGGAGAAGGTAPGAGGVGVENSISGVSRFWAGGGGPSGYSGNGGNGGAGGGGGGAVGATTGGAGLNPGSPGGGGTSNGQTNTPGGNGGANTGGGGGGGSHYSANNFGGTGGSGIVIIRYAGAAKGTGGIITTVGSDTVHTFITSGTLNLALESYDPGINVDTPSVYNGDSIKIVYVDQAQADNATVAYTITGVASSDIDDAALTGNFIMSAGIAYLTLTATNVVNKTLTITVGGSSENASLQYGIDVQYLVVAGGGGGGTDMGGGGGAGGYIAEQEVNIAAGTYSIVVGGGGNGAPQTATNASARGSNGTNTTFNGLTVIGGGGGASNHSNNISNAGNGGSGGGGSGGRMSSASYGGLAGTGTAGQGFNGAGSGITWYPGGGGGAGAAASQTGSQQADGGIGKLNAILGTAYYWAGGGAGAGYSTWGGNGGLGGGGGGAPRQGTGTTNGTGSGSALNPGSNAGIGTLGGQANVAGGAAGANTGSGGGGGSHYFGANQGGNGGSGIAVFRYNGSLKAAGGTVTTVGADTVHTFTTSGTFTVFPGEGLASTVSSAFFGETFEIYYILDAADNTTIPYTITGVTSAQISDASLTGNFTIVNGRASITINLSRQSTNSVATFTITAGAYSNTVPISNLVSFASSAAGTYWGGSIIFTAQTKGLTVSGGTVSYSISGVTSAQISNAALTGAVTHVPGAGLNGTATFTVVANAAEPVLNSATMVTSITGASLTTLFRTGRPRLSESYRSSVNSLVFIDTEVTDVHFEDLEARVNALTNITSQLEVSQLKLSPSAMVFIDTEVTDVHFEDLEARVNALTNINSSLELSKLNSSLNGFVAAPTFAYSSGEDIKVTPQVIQIWFI